MTFPLKGINVCTPICLILYLLGFLSSFGCLFPSAFVWIPYSSSLFSFSICFWTHFYPNVCKCVLPRPYICKHLSFPVWFAIKMKHLHLAYCFSSLFNFLMHRRTMFMVKFPTCFPGIFYHHFLSLF